MRRVWLAIRVFFLCLLSSAVAREVAKALAERRGKAAVPEGAPQAKAPAPPKAAAPKPAPPKPARNDALALLAALQREGRLVDFLEEPLAGYSDAQVGAVARDVHRDCAAVLERMFAIRPAVKEEENAEVELPAGFDAGRWRLTGNVAGAGPFRGRLVHPGWEATRCELPTWSGSAATTRVIAAAEVEVA